MERCCKKTVQSQGVEMVSKLPELDRAIVAFLELGYNSE